MTLETFPWDTAEVLNTPDMRSAYWEAALEDVTDRGDMQFLQKVLTILERAMALHGASFGEETVHSAREALAIAMGMPTQG